MTPGSLCGARAGKRSPDGLVRSRTRGEYLWGQERRVFEAEGYSQQRPHPSRGSRHERFGFFVSGNSWRQETALLSDWSAGKHGKLHLALFSLLKAKLYGHQLERERHVRRNWKRWGRFRVECDERGTGHSQVTEWVSNWGDPQALVFVCE